MNKFVSVLSFISNICSIIGLPIALFQIWKIRSSTKTMQQSIYNFLKLEEIATINKIFDTITAQRNNLVSTYSKTTKEGIKIEKIKSECENSIKEINTCMDNLPGEFKEIESVLIDSTKRLNKYIEDNDTSNIKEGEDLLQCAISMLKEIKEKRRRFEVETASKCS